VGAGAAVEARAGRASGGWRARALAAALLSLALAAQLAAVFRANVHWDEFALLHQADLTRATGVFESGGRPGLATLALLPFVARCDDEIAVVRRARLLWLLVTCVYLAGVALWAAQLAPDAAQGRRDAALVLGLLAGVPAFLESSLQVRADQLALAGAAWGGAWLAASRRRPALAPAAGLAFGLGLLASQKLLYAAALAALLAAGDLWLRRELRPRREALRALGCALGAAAVVLAYRAALGGHFELAPSAPARAPLSREALASGLSIFEFYRRTIGWSQYAEIAPTLLPHALLALALAFASFRARGGARRRLVLAWAALALGAGVAFFHAARFSYFWMTLGLFPALALGLARAPLAALALPRAPRARALAVAGLCSALALPGLAALGLRLRDAQAVQRESLAFVHRNFPRSAAGFHPERGLFCQAGAQAQLTWFSQHIYQRFGRDPGLAQSFAQALLDDFRSEPVLFLLQSFRLNQFPPEVRRFWAENYQPYRGAVFVAGRSLAGARGERSAFELVAPGSYRWLPAQAGAPVAIDGRLLRAGEVAELAPGAHEASFIEDVPGGLLVLALAEPPGPAPLPFYE
jgi:hypothetical protein